jgi:hypothetical protein
MQTYPHSRHIATPIASWIISALGLQSFAMVLLHSASISLQQLQALRFLVYNSLLPTLLGSLPLDSSDG